MVLTRPWNEYSTKEKVVLLPTLGAVGVIMVGGAFVTGVIYVADRLKTSQASHDGRQL